VHTNQDGSRQAIRYFTELLEDTGGEHLRARWLLNIAHMTIGGYPGDVPEAYLIPPEAFESDEPFPRFPNIASRLGLDTFNHFGGAVVDDFDGDGYLDIITTTWDPRGPMHFFRSRGDGTFEDRTEAAGLEGFYGGLNIVQADYDNDGDIDLYILRGAWLLTAGLHPNSLLRNDGDGTFTDLTYDAGLGKTHFPTQTAAWGDYDNDGHVDLYVGNEHYAQGGVVASSNLFRNNGDGTFTDVAREVNAINLRYAKGVVWGDYDDDGFQDLYISNMEQPNRLYRNNGDGSFTDVAEALGVTEPVSSFPVWFWDFDNDGVLDLYVPSYLGSPPALEGLAASYLGLPTPVEPHRLYRGDGRGGFEDVAQDRDLGRVAYPMAANFGDLDNDGWLDFYLGTGYPDYEALMPNVMYRNVGGRRFADVTSAGGFGHLQKGHGIAFADLDNDGDQDVFEQMGGAYPGDRFRDALYENPGFDNHWLAIELVGRRSNRSAIGARIRVDIVENGARRSIYKHVNSGGSFGSNPLRQTIGLGKAQRIERLEVRWPATGHTQSFDDVAADRFVRIVEDEDAIVPVPLRRIALGG
jgi:hypothetical protein